MYHGSHSQSRHLGMRISSPRYPSCTRSSNSTGIPLLTIFPAVLSTIGLNASTRPLICSVVCFAFAMLFSPFCSRFGRALFSHGVLPRSTDPPFPSTRPGGRGVAFRIGPCGGHCNGKMINLSILKFQKYFKLLFYT